MKKSKGQTIDLLYTNKKETTKKKTKKTNKSNKTTKKKKDKLKKSKSSIERINLDNEIIIGLTPKKEEPKKSNKNTKSKQKTKKNNNSSKGKLNKNKKNNTKSANKKNNSQNRKNKSYIKTKKNSKDKRFLKWIIIILLLIIAIALFMLSSIFNIKQIVVINNDKISSEEIINLSKITIGTNMFKTTNSTIRNNLKENAYIDNVKVKRNINGTLTLEIEERKPTYMLIVDKKYVYINNQGYILEISKKRLKIPVIVGLSTPKEETNIGNRLNVEDLGKLDGIIKIMESAKNISFYNKITKIDVSDITDYKLTIKSEKKTIRIGEISNINIKLQMAGQVIKEEKGKSGEIYFQEDGKKAIFKENV